MLKHFALVGLVAASFAAAPATRPATTQAAQSPEQIVQRLGDTTLSFDYRNATLARVIDDWQKATGVRFVYDPRGTRTPDSIAVEQSARDLKLVDALARVLNSIHHTYRVRPGYVYIRQALHDETANEPVIERSTPAGSMKR